MSLSALKEAILKEAREQASVVKQNASERITAEQQRTASELGAQEETIVASARKEGEREMRSLHQQAELTGRARILIAKQEELDATKKAFVEYLLSLDASAQKALRKDLEAMLPNIKGTIVDGNKKEGGFVFKSKDVEVNLTYSYLADNIFWKYRAEIAKELF